MCSVLINRAGTTEHGASHLPDLQGMDRFVDLACLINYCILSNVLDPRTYNFPDIDYGRAASSTHIAQRIQFDYNALSPNDRLHFSYIRGLAINLIDWVNCNYVFFDEDRNPQDFTTLARKFLHQQVRAILKYKIMAQKSKIRGVPNCSAVDVRRQIELLFAEGMPELRGLSIAELRDAESLSWPYDDNVLTPEKQSTPWKFTGKVYFIGQRPS